MSFEEILEIAMSSALAGALFSFWFFFEFIAK